ncbi:MAG: hypothetical protein ABR538_16940 [Candidatus Binatia bacterium]
MMRSIAPSMASLLTLTILALAAPASAQFDQETLKCRAAVAKAGLKLAKSSFKAIAGCHKMRGGDADLEGTDCNVLASADVKNAMPGAESKFGLFIEDRCATVTPAAALYEACPATCADDVPTIATFSDVSDCLVCLNRARIEHFAQEAFGSPVAPLESGEAGCHRSIVKNGSRLVESAIKTVSKCQAKAEKDGATTTTDCVETDFDTLTATAYAQTLGKISDGKCAELPLPQASFDACGNAGNTSTLASCVGSNGLTDSASLVTALLELPAPTATTTTTTTTTLAVGDPECPDTADLFLHSRDSNIACVDDNDCSAPSTCDLALGRCSTPTDHDEGWTGLAHDSDTNDGVRERLHLYCPGPDAPGCGECTLQGLSPEPGNCRCSNDLRQVCDTPFSSNGCAATYSCDAGPFQGDTCIVAGDCDAGACARRCSNDNATVCTTDGDCPGGTCRLLSDKRCGDGSACDSTQDCSGECASLEGTCDCFLGAPVPTSMGGTPMCVVQRFEDNVSGTLNVDTGEMALSTMLRATIHLGISTLGACPTCGGTCSDDAEQFCTSDADCAMGTCGVDPTPGDGVRGGTCTGGANEGLSCDASATNASFPATPGSTGGGSYSLDCLPTVGSNVSGSGLLISLAQGTDASQLDADLSCGGVAPELSCPCLQCSGDTTVACNSDLDCAATPGKCTSANLTCEDDGDCSSADVGPCITFISRCSKQTSRVCATNADCTAVDVGTCDPSTCSSAGGLAGSFPLPNGCDDLLCSDAGGGEGECTTGPDDRFCDGVTKANGEGILACAADIDCAPETVGVDAGECTLVQRRECFLDSIVASGDSDPNYPVLAATHCLPPSSNAGVNIVSGRPGPARLLQQTTLTSYCGMTTYSPGAGCP